MKKCEDLNKCNRPAKLSDIMNFFRLLYQKGEVVEIRAFGLSGKNSAWEGFAAGQGVVFGYFDNAEAFAQAVLRLEKAGAKGIYCTLNPVIPDFLARSKNRLQAASARSKLTSDSDIACVRWLPLDLDPVRRSGNRFLDSSIATTEEELRAAADVR